MYFLPCLLIVRRLNPITWKDSNGSYQWLIFCFNFSGQRVSYWLGYLTNVLQSDILEKYDLDFQILFVSTFIQTYFSLFEQSTILKF
jgi:hypothetical protein